MPTIPAKWRRYLYAVSVATVPVLVVAGWVSDQLAVALIGLANAIFMGALAAANTDVDS
jgi:hypothetical protein